MAERVQTSRIDIPTWLADLRAVYNTAPIAGGAVGLLEVLNLQLEQAGNYTDGLSGDVFVERGLGSFREDYAAAVERLRWMARKYVAIQQSGDPPEVRLLAIQNFVANPILDGRYPAPMMTELQPEWRRGIVLLPGGAGKGFGDAVSSATLWNQAVVAGDIDNKLSPLGGRTVIEDGLRRMFTQAAVEVRRSAQGEDPTLADATAAKLNELAALPGALLRELGASNVVAVIGIGIGIYIAWRLFSR